MKIKNLSTICEFYQQKYNYLCIILTITTHNNNRNFKRRMQWKNVKRKIKNHAQRTAQIALTQMRQALVTAMVQNVN